MGRAVVQRLAAENHRVFGLRRSAAGRASASNPGIATWRLGNVTRPGFLSDAMTGMDAVIHLVGIISEAGDSTFENVHAQGARNVIEAMRRAGVRRIIHMSALGTRPNAVSRYHQTKWLAEEAVRSSGLAWTIFRPSLIYGPRDHFINMFSRMSAFSPALPVMGRPAAKFAPTHVNVVADAFVKALVNPAAEGRVFDLCGPREMTLREILDALLKAKHRRRFIVRVPARVAKAQAAFLEVLFGGILRTPPPLNRDQLIMLDEGNVGDASAADSLFGLSHPPFEKALEDQLSARGR